MISQMVSLYMKFRIEGSSCCETLPGRDKRSVSSVKGPNRLWRPPDLLLDGYRLLLPGNQLRSELHPLTRSKTHVACLCRTVCLNYTHRVFTSNVIT
jgi:hypothetical protein